MRGSSLHPKPARSQRINVRATPRQEQLLRRAAEATDRSMTDFILESASAEAERILADRLLFVADEPQWAEFNRLLELPLTSTAKLAKLARRPSPFQGE
ncbi:DUF1778 domain-containing protein [Paenarthrobacter sp. PH39-S1]|uniref:type II toxin-antitoxin system TacA family antitoxin n=1 Tax=Paenarthrobacter sp. PH39-S1 TaxID=3046204 RepID=UPI0024BBDFDD|nr:DUF1778 domain-containing protein [Paenarthrobacter sp. PH39-S1]MDJ0355727.1 DUF1778 domain-containing protein [Paenarthrobacter sp. PH39-S1]